MAKLCVITHVKDEAHILPGWFETHRPLAEMSGGCMALIDTGSTDRSIEVAVEHGAHVAHADIEQGFDVVRTFCITTAAELGCEWVLILDADERVFPQVPELALRIEETPIDMSKEWPAGLTAPTHCKFEAVRMGRTINQADLICDIINHPDYIACQTRRRHWFDWGMTRPCQQWRECGDLPPIPDWQGRFCRTDKGLRYVRKVHEWLRCADGSVPEPTYMCPPEGPFFDHFHVPAKRLTPGRAEGVSALCSRLFEGDSEWKATY